MSIRDTDNLMKLICAKGGWDEELSADSDDIGSYANLIDTISRGMLFTFDMDHYDSSRRMINPVGVHWIKARQFLELAEQELRLAEYHAIEQGKLTNEDSGE